MRVTHIIYVWCISSTIIEKQRLFIIKLIETYQMLGTFRYSIVSGIFMFVASFTRMFIHIILTLYTCLGSDNPQT